MEEKLGVEEMKDGIKISDEVIAVITGVAASETEGVAAVGNGSIASNWAELISGKKNTSKGIRLSVEENKVSVEVQIMVKYGVCIPDVALSVQTNVKNAVEEMTGLSVEKIDVRVTGIKMAAEEKKPQTAHADETADKKESE